MSGNILHQLINGYSTDIYASYSTDIQRIITNYSARDIGRSSEYHLPGNGPDKYTVSISIYTFRIHSTGNTSHPYFYRAKLNDNFLIYQPPTATNMATINHSQLYPSIMDTTQPLFFPSLSPSLHILTRNITPHHGTTYALEYYTP